MRSRAVRGPLVVGLGTASILAAAAVPALAFALDGSSPTPTASGTENTSAPPSNGTPPVKLDLTAVRTSNATVHPGDRVDVKVTVSAKTQVDGSVSLTVLAGNDGVVTSKSCGLSKDVCTLSDVGPTVISLSFQVTIIREPKSGKVVFSAEATGDNAVDPGKKTVSINVAPVTPPTKPTKSPSPTPTPSTSKSASPKPSSTKSSSSNSNNANTTSNANNSATTPNGSAAQPPDVANLPNIGSNGNAQNPAVAPQAAETAGNTTALRNGSADAQELTFQRLASTQAAWLASLLIIFAMLLTQVRLGRRANPATAKNRPAHERPRKGRFQV